MRFQSDLPTATWPHHRVVKMSRRSLLHLVGLAVAAHARRIYAAGSGHNMLGLAATVKEVIALSEKLTPRVLYLGTATYDDPSSMEGQTQNFAAMGCVRAAGLELTLVELHLILQSRLNPTLDRA